MEVMESKQEKASAAYVSTVGIQSQSRDWARGGVRECLSNRDRKGTYDALKGRIL